MYICMCVSIRMYIHLHVSHTQDVELTHGIVHARAVSGQASRLFLDFVGLDFAHPVFFFFSLCICP